jgi:hypothetical protein
MPSQWKQEFKSLTDFIASHPEIVITTSEVSIPQSLRDEFYRRFDEIRRLVIEDRCAVLSEEFQLLSENYSQVEKEIKDLLDLEDISAPTELLIFLRNPKEGLIRSLYNRLFDLLQGKIAFEDFETLADVDLNVAAATLCRLGYERWATLALIKSLDPDEAFQIDLDDDYKPILGELKSICFGRQAHHPTIRIPEFVIHSRKIGKYVTFKMAMVREIQGYAGQVRPHVRPRNRTGDTSLVLDTRAILLSFLSDPKEIPIIAEIFECTRTSPDWLIQFIGFDELNDPRSLEPLYQNMEAMNPMRGIGLILVGTGDESIQEKIPESIDTVAFGFDQFKLQSFIDTRLNAADSPEPPNPDNARNA